MRRWKEMEDLREKKLHQDDQSQEGGTGTSIPPAGDLRIRSTSNRSSLIQSVLVQQRTFWAKW